MGYHALFGELVRLAFYSVLVEESLNDCLKPAFAHVGCAFAQKQIKHCIDLVEVGVRDTLQKILEPLSLHLLKHLDYLLQNPKFLKFHPASPQPRDGSSRDLRAQILGVCALRAVEEHDKRMEKFLKRQFRLTQRQIEQIDNGFNGGRGGFLIMGVDGNSEIQKLRQGNRSNTLGLAMA